MLIAMITTLAPWMPAAMASVRMLRFRAMTITPAQQTPATTEHVRIRLWFAMTIVIALMISAWRDLASLIPSPAAIIILARLMAAFPQADALSRQSPTAARRHLNVTKTTPVQPMPAITERVQILRLSATTTVYAQQIYA